MDIFYVPRLLQKHFKITLLNQQKFKWRESSIKANMQDLYFILPKTQSLW